MAARNSGAKVVGIAVAATIGFVGVGTLYLPFYADKDRLRGLHEEGDLTDSERREYEEYVMKMAQAQQEAGKQPNETSGLGRTQNSMWKRMHEPGTGVQK
jgi:hypothetical protein